jgi:hypothetical protein
MMRRETHSEIGFMKTYRVSLGCLDEHLRTEVISMKYVALISALVLTFAASVAANAATRVRLAEAQAPRECVANCESANFSCAQNCGLSGACVAQCNATSASCKAACASTK